MTINKFGQSEFRQSRSQQDITKAYVHANFVKKPLPNFVSQEQLKEAQSSMFCQIVAFLIKENLISIQNIEAFETKWFQFETIDDCYNTLVEKIEGSRPLSPIVEEDESTVEYIEIIPKDPPKTSVPPVESPPPRYPVAG